MPVAVNITDKTEDKRATVSTMLPVGDEPGLYVRIVSQPAGAGSGPATIADGADVTQGAKADAAVTDSTTSNTAQSFLKGLVKILADVWDSVNHRLKVDGSGVTQPVSATALPLPTGASTETTLASVKAKTDNLDVLLSSRTKPADQQHAIVDSSALPTGAATDAGLAVLHADLIATEPRDVTDRAARLLGHVTVDSGGGGTEYTDGATTSPSVGKMAMAVVSETPENYIDRELRPISLTNEGRLRVSAVSAIMFMDFFAVQGNPFFQVPALTNGENIWFEKTPGGYL